MAIRKHRPVTPGQRGSSVADFQDITRTAPETALLRPLSKSGGRNNLGRITSRHRGGGHKRKYSLLEFSRHDKDRRKANDEQLEYDPKRPGIIALVHDVEGAKRYILAPAR